MEFSGEIRWYSLRSISLRNDYLRKLFKHYESLSPNQAEIPRRDELESRREEVGKAGQERSKPITSSGSKAKDGKGQRRRGWAGRKPVQEKKSSKKLDESEEEGTDSNRNSAKSSKRPHRGRSPSV